MVRMTGLEPVCFSARDFKSLVSADSTTSAYLVIVFISSMIVLYYNLICLSSVILEFTENIFQDYSVNALTIFLTQSIPREIEQNKPIIGIKVITNGSFVQPLIHQSQL